MYGNKVVPAVRWWTWPAAKWKISS